MSNYWEKNNGKNLKTFKQKSEKSRKKTMEKIKKALIVNKTTKKSREKTVEKVIEIVENRSKMMKNIELLKKNNGRKIEKCLNKTSKKSREKNEKKN